MWSFFGPIQELWSLIYDMGSHSVTCHSTQVNKPYLNHSQVTLVILRFTSH